MTRTRLLASAAALALAPLHAAAQDAFLLDEIVVSPNAAPIARERAGASLIVVTETELAASGDVQLTEYLARLPGITLDQSGPTGTFADLRIRGARSRYISVYVDGILVTDPSTPSRQFEDFGGLTTGGIRRIEILKGSQSALYGGTAVGGVISIETLGGLELGEGTHQSAGLTFGSSGTATADYALTRNTGPLSLSLALSHARADGFSAADEANGNTEADGFDRTRLSFGASYAVSDRVTVGINGFAETGRSEFDEFQSVAPFLPTDGTPGDEFSDRDTRGLRLWTEVQSGAWTHAFALSGYTTDRTSSSNGFASEFASRRLAADYVATGQMSDALRLSFGLSYLDERAESGGLPGGSAETTSAGVFAEAVWSPSDRVDVTTTLRQDDHSVFGGFTTGRVAFAWRPAEGTTIRGAAGTGYRPPAISELYDDFGSFVGNPDLDPETSRTVEVGFDQRFANGAEFSATVFETRIDDLITFAFGSPSTLENVAGESRIRGVEVAGRTPITDRFALYGSATFLDAEDATGTALPRTPRRDMVIGLEADLTDRLSADVSLRAVGGLPNLDNYRIVNAGLTYAVTDGVDAFLWGRNLTDEQYQTAPGYGTAGRSVFVGLRARY
jgi:vitamin B12 transporter